MTVQEITDIFVDAMTEYLGSFERFVDAMRIDSLNDLQGLEARHHIMEILYNMKEDPDRTYGPEDLVMLATSDREVDSFIRNVDKFWRSYCYDYDIKLGERA